MRGGTLGASGRCDVRVGRGRIMGSKLEGKSKRRRGTRRALRRLERHPSRYGQSSRASGDPALCQGLKGERSWQKRRPIDERAFALLSIRLGVVRFALGRIRKRVCGRRGAGRHQPNQRPCNLLRRTERQRGGCLWLSRAVRSIGIAGKRESCSRLCRRRQKEIDEIRETTPRICGGRLTGARRVLLRSCGPCPDRSQRVHAGLTVQVRRQKVGMRKVQALRAFAASVNCRLVPNRHFIGASPSALVFHIGAGLGAY